MRYDYVHSEILKLLNADWHARAQQVEDAREARGEHRQALVPPYVVERMFERGNGRRIDSDGEVSKVLSGSSAKM